MASFNEYALRAEKLLFEKNKYRFYVTLKENGEVVVQKKLRECFKFYEDRTDDWHCGDRYQLTQECYEYLEKEIRPEDLREELKEAGASEIEIGWAMEDLEKAVEEAKKIYEEYLEAKRLEEEERKKLEEEERERKALWAELMKELMKLEPKEMSREELKELLREIKDKHDEYCAVRFMMNGKEVCSISAFSDEECIEENEELLRRIASALYRRSSAAEKKINKRPAELARHPTRYVPFKKAVEKEIKNEVIRELLLRWWNKIKHSFKDKKISEIIVFPQRAWVKIEKVEPYLKLGEHIVELRGAEYEKPLEDGVKISIKVEFKDGSEKRFYLLFWRGSLCEVDEKSFWEL